MQSTSFASVVISAAHLLALTGYETENDSILLIHTDTVKPIKIASELLQSVRRRNSQVFERGTGIQQIELLLYSPSKHARQLTSSFALAPVKNVGRGRVREADNHSSQMNYTRE